MLSLDLFRGLAAEFEAREYAAGAPIFESGDLGRDLFLLHSGSVQLYRSAGRHRLIVAELTPPDLFGEMALVGDSAYCCSAQAITAARVCILPRSELEPLLDRHPDLARDLLEILAGRFARLLAEFESAASRPLLPRLAELLLDRASHDVVNNLTHQEIASRLRVHRESVSSALGELRRAGILATDRKCIRVLNRMRLERASRERD